MVTLSAQPIGVAITSRRRTLKVPALLRNCLRAQWHHFCPVLIDRVRMAGDVPRWAPSGVMVVTFPRRANPSPDPPRQTGPVRPLRQDGGQGASHGGIALSTHRRCRRLWRPSGVSPFTLVGTMRNWDDTS